MRRRILCLLNSALIFAEWLVWIDNDDDADDAAEDDDAGDDVEDVAAADIAIDDVDDYDDAKSGRNILLTITSPT